MKTLSCFALFAVVGFATEARFEVVVSVAFAVGIAVIAIQDYGRRIKPLPVAPRARRVAPARFLPPPLNIETHRLAA